MNFDKWFADYGPYTFCSAMARTLAEKWGGYLHRSFGEFEMINRILDSIANGLGLMYAEVTPTSTFRSTTLSAESGHRTSVADVLNYFKERK
jgi:hypothetical protein